MLPIEWNISDGLTGYLQAVQVMETRADAIAKGDAPEAILSKALADWFHNNPPYGIRA